MLRRCGSERDATDVLRIPQTVDERVRDSAAPQRADCAVRACCLRGGNWARPQRTGVYTLCGEPDAATRLRAPV